MTISLHEVRAIAEYARVALGEDELVEMTCYLNETLEHVLAPVLSFELEGVEPVFHPIGGVANVMREDVPVEGLGLQEALANAGETEGRFFCVPAILGGGGEA